jgi:hypothetical protein
MKDWVWTKAYVLEVQSDDGEWSEMDISFSEDVMQGVGDDVVNKTGQYVAYNVVGVPLKYLGGGADDVPTGTVVWVKSNLMTDANLLDTDFLTSHE